ncbi:MAG: N-acetylmuramoyl-L-alanine amidase [Bacteroidetes Order II. Incertae sedis bacterium]|nr:N-acetylmuramoyl-L-alanine amidase [Bacteroidetes Order II. bacterium]
MAVFNRTISDPTELRFLHRWLLSLALLLLVGTIFFAENLVTFFQPSQPVQVIIDPNYPIKDNDGRQVINDTFPLKTNWEVARRVSEILNDRYKVSVLLSRNDMDDLASPAERAAVANRNKALLLVRLDVNAGVGSGYTVFYTDRFKTDKAASLGLVGLSQKAAYLIDHNLRVSLRDMMVANDVAPERDIPSAATERSSWFSEVPSVTVQMATLTNMFDALYINSEMGQNKTAEVIAQSIVAYLRATGAPVTAL